MHPLPKDLAAIRQRLEERAGEEVPNSIWEHLIEYNAVKDYLGNINTTSWGTLYNMTRMLLDYSRTAIESGEVSTGDSNQRTATDRLIAGSSLASETGNFVLPEINKADLYRAKALAYYEAFHARTPVENCRRAIFGEEVMDRGETRGRKLIRPWGEFLASPAVGLLTPEEFHALGFDLARDSLDCECQEEPNGWPFTSLIRFTQTGRVAKVSHTQQAQKLNTYDLVKYKFIPNYVVVYAFPGSVLAQLMECSADLAEKLHWGEWGTMEFILTGTMPDILPVHVFEEKAYVQLPRYDHRAALQSARQEVASWQPSHPYDMQPSIEDIEDFSGSFSADRYMTLQVAPWLPPATVNKIFKKVQEQTVGSVRYHAPLGLRKLELVHFVMQAMLDEARRFRWAPEDWERLCAIWNKQHPSEKCASGSKMEREFAEAESQLFRCQTQPKRPRGRPPKR